jgi:hypothetical protein
MGYTRSENAVDPSTVPPESAQDRVFAAAFPSSVLEGLPCLDGTA